MKAMILAAGLGSRLRPMTDKKPKALVKLFNMSLLEIQIRKLISAGVNSIIINVHHYAGQIIDFVKVNNSFGINIEFSDESDKLLDTGGGIVKASWFLKDNKPVIVSNTDIISDLDYNSMIKHHIKLKNLVTLAVRNRKSSRYLMFDTNNLLCGWKNTSTKETIHYNDKPAAYESAFSGIHILSPGFFQLRHPEGKHSIIKTYLRLSAKERIMAYNHDHTIWYDVGKVDTLKELNADKKLEKRILNTMKL